jgi:hypothetical protein
MDEQLATLPIPDQQPPSPYADCPAVMTDADLHTPPSDDYDSVDLHDPMFLHTEICNLWREHRQHGGDIQAERTKMLAVGQSLGELLYAMKALLASTGRSGRWSAYLRANKFSRATADRLVSQFAASKGLSPKRLNEAIQTEPTESEISKLFASLWPRCEKVLTTHRSRYAFLRCFVGHSGLAHDWQEGGILVHETTCVPSEEQAVLTSVQENELPSIADPDGDVL